MDSYKVVFQKAVHAKLKEKIFGKIFVKITYYDELYVKISSYGDVEYCMRIDDFSNKVLNGYSADNVVVEVIKEYKRYLIQKTMEKHFIQEKREVL